MFSSLKNVLQKDWYQNPENRFIQFSTRYQDCVWEIFSIYKTKAETYCTTTHFSSSNQYEDFLTTLLERSIYNFNTPVTAEDTILTLYTCDTFNTNRVIVHAKLIKE